MDLKIKILSPHAVMPEYQTSGASGFDLHYAGTVPIEIRGRPVIIPIGLAVEVPMGYEMQVRPRSGWTFRHRVSAALGTIDSDYRGEISVQLEPATYEYGVTVEPGDRVAQGVIVPVQRVRLVQVDDLTPTRRGDGGFGSTGK